MNNVEIVNGDLFESECECWTNAVNCIGVMGAGIALGFYERFPVMFVAYAEACADDRLKVGVPVLWVNDGSGAGDTKHDVLNFPTMFYPGEEADESAILLGLELLPKLYEYDKWTFGSLAVPALGCGIGGLDWDKVCPKFVERLEQLPIPVELYAPNERALGNPYGGELGVTVEDVQRT